MVNNGAKRTDVSDVGNKVDDLKNAIAGESDDMKNAIAGESEKGIENYYNNQKMTFDAGEVSPIDTFDSVAGMQATVNNNLWSAIALGFKGGDIKFGKDGETINFDAKDFIENDGIGKSAYGIFIVFGYSIVLLFFAVSLVDQTIKYEIFTVRGAVGIFGRLLISKAIIDMSGFVCTTIITISQKLCNQLLTETVVTNLMNHPKIEVVPSDIFVIGPIVDVLTQMILSSPVVIIATVVFSSGVLIMIKLLLRSFELTMLTVVSPAFFACVSSNTTVPYFKNFITTFIQAAIQIVFMAIVYVVAVDKLTIDNIDGFADLGKWFIRVLPNSIIVLAMAIMMVKPPRVLTGLLR